MASLISVGSLLLSLAFQIRFNDAHRAVWCCVDGGWFALPWAAWLSHIRKRGRLDLRRRSLGIPWGLGRQGIEKG